MTYRSNRRSRLRRNPVRQRSDGRWDVLKPDGSVDLTLGDEQTARRLAAACGYDVAPAPAAPREPIAAPRKAAAPRKPSAPRKAASRKPSSTPKPAASARSKSVVPRIEGWGNVDAFCKAEYWYDTKKEALKKTEHLKDLFRWGKDYQKALKEAMQKGGVTENQFEYIRAMCDLQEVIDKWEEYKAIAEQYKEKFGKPLAKEFESTDPDKRFSPAWELRRAGWEMSDARDKVMRDEEPNPYTRFDTLNQLGSVKDEIQKLLNQTHPAVTVAKRKLTGEKGTFRDLYKLVVTAPNGHKEEYISRDLVYLHQKECLPSYDYYGDDYDCDYYAKSFDGEWEEYHPTDMDLFPSYASFVKGTLKNPSRRTRRPRRRRRR